MKAIETKAVHSERMGGLTGAARNKKGGGPNFFVMIIVHTNRKVFI